MSKCTWNSYKLKSKHRIFILRAKEKRNRPEDDRYLMYFEEIERNV